jgi:hypothetical protein
LLQPINGDVYNCLQAGGRILLVERTARFIKIKHFTVQVLPNLRGKLRRRPYIITVLFLEPLIRQPTL